MTKSRSIGRFLALALAAPLVGLPASSALAEEPTTPAEARAAAEHQQELAKHYDSLGGVGYKTGIVQRAEADARRYDALADELAGAPEVPSPKAQCNPACMPTKPSVPCPQ
jgi:hypothetical protein